MKNGDSSYLVIGSSQQSDRSFMLWFEIEIQGESGEEWCTHFAGRAWELWGCFMASWQVEYSSVCAQRQPPRLVSSQVPVRYVVGSIKTYQAEVLLVLPNSLHLWGVQNRFIIGHALLCVFLIFFLGIGFNNEDGKHQRAMDQWDLK